MPPTIPSRCADKRAGTALRYGFPESDAMYAASLTSGTDIPDKRIERIVVTVMGGDNAYLSPR